jgi:hypothetical protein
MRKQQLPEPSKRKNKGQSLVELTLVLMLLLTLLVGMVEFGNLLNQYVNIVDGTREGARFASNDDPFVHIVQTGCATPPCLRENFFINIDQIVEGVLDEHGVRVPSEKGAIAPIRLDPDKGDDVIISFFSIDTGVPKRFPEGTGDDGWSYYHHATEPPVGSRLKSAFSLTDIQSRLDSAAPNTGLVLVEIYYHYSQILRMWTFIGIPDPIRVHAYSIMPLSAAEPTPIP